MANSQLGAIVLAGGKSTRMGKDKWLLPIGGKLVLERITDQLHASCREIWIVLAGCAASERDFPEVPDTVLRLPRVRIIRDRESGLGPLGGMAAGLAASNCPYNLVVAADMPFPSLRLAEYLESVCRDSGFSAAVPEWDGRLNPLFAVYRREVSGSLDAFIREGGRKAMEWLARLDASVIPEREVRRLDPSGMSLFNMNRPEDYDFALRYYEKTASP